MAKRVNLKYKMNIQRHYYHPKMERKVPVLVEKEFTLKTHEVRVEGRPREVGTINGNEVLIAHKAGLSSVSDGVEDKNIEAEVWANKTKYKRYLEYHGKRR